MAYGEWTYKWIQIYTNNYYNIDVEWGYRQDPVNNKTEIVVCQLRVDPIAGSTFVTGNAEAGIGSITSDRTIETGLSVDTRNDTTVVLNLTNKSREIAMGSDGSVGERTYVHGYFAANYSGYNAPNMTDWATPEVTSEIPSIDRTPPIATAKLVSKTHNSITLDLTSDSLSKEACYRINGGAWQYFSTVGTDVDKTNGGTIRKTFDGLTPNASYKIEVEFKRNYNGVWSNNATITEKTNKPQAPTVGTVTVSEITTNSAKFTFSGFSFGNGATFGNYQYSLDGSTWIDNGQSTTVLKTDLKPETEYTVYVRLVDNYGTSSEIVSANFTTLSGQAKAYINVEGQIFKGKVGIVINDVPKKAKEIYYVEDGIVKKL